jgi:hypothetical protein
VFQFLAKYFSTIPNNEPLISKNAIFFKITYILGHSTKGILGARKVKAPSKCTMKFAQN